MNRLKIKLIILLFGFLTSSPLFANVSLKNGNFFIGYTDIIYPGGFQPKVERVYNSKTPYRGIFGHGWGTEYEVYLTVSADASVVVHEYGGGAENRFVPVGFREKDLKGAVDRLAKAAMKLGGVSKGRVSQYKKKLKRDAIFRNDEWEKFVRKGLMKRITLKPKTQLISNRFSYQYITKVKGGYIRKFDNGRIEQFNDLGKLVRISDKNNNFIKFKYNKSGFIQSLVDNFNRKMFFTFNNKGLVIKIEGENKKKANYRYNKLDELVYSRDVDGNTYQFGYSKDKIHNMTQIRYSNKTTMKIAYYGKDKFQNVKSVKDPDGTLTNYDYSWDKKDRGHFKVSVKVKNRKGQQISKSNYEYFLKYKRTGEEWTQRMIATVDGQTTDTTYNECCGLPVRIKRGKELTEFRYDKKGRVTWKNTPTEITKLQYHKTFGKVVRVDKTSKRRKKKKSWSTFKYDRKGNLVFARNSAKKTVKLFYDRFGRIRSMMDQKKKRIDFKYNENSKPIEIRDPKLGAIKVVYNNSGEIQDVKSTAGRKIALQVTSGFQNLLEIIRPAGVTLSF